MMTFPNDWTETTLGKSVQIARGASPRPIEAFLTASIDGVNWIKIGDAPKNSKYITHTAEKITVSGARKSVTVREGDFILSNSMSFGKPYILTVDGCIHDGWLRLFDYNEQINKEFLYYILFFRHIQEQFATFAAGSGVQNLNKDVVKRVVVHLPSKPEQKAIAEILTVFDTHIANLTELIEKKKAIREGALEDLISGKTRLSGFNSEWISISFDEYFTLLSNNTYSRDKLAEHGQVGNIHYGDILIKYSEIVTDEDEIPFLRPEITYSDNWLLHTNDVIIADTAEDGTVGKAIQICEVSVPLVGGLHTIVCRPKFETAHGFLGLYINSKSYHDQLLPHITGIKVSSISKKAIKTTVLTIPSEIEEQSAIVGIITAMDKEIRSLEEERDKMIKIREGAMDDLLTGKVRLTD